MSLSLKKKKKTVIALPTEKEELDRRAEGVIPTNTKCSDKALHTFTSWVAQRNDKVTKDPIPFDLLENHNVEKVNYYMRLFVLETRRAVTRSFSRLLQLRQGHDSYFHSVSSFSRVTLAIWCRALPSSSVTMEV